MRPTSALSIAVLATSFLLGAATPAPARAADTAAPAGCPALLNDTYPRLQDESPQSLCQYAGRVLLVVNTASYCGFTPQYEGLERLYARYRARGLEILAFPSNDFGQQEPGGAKEIADLCFNTYGVKFPIFSKAVVTGPQANPLFARLTQATGSAPQWNFHKYLVDRQGRPVSAFPSKVEPEDPVLVRELETLLSRP
jgi:glutathione peroxidase